MHILNFFAPNFGSPCLIQSSIISYQRNFHQKQLVELFVQGVLGDLVHQNKILSFDIDSATLITEPSLFSLSLGFSRCPVSWFSFGKSKSHQETCKTEISNTLGTPNSSVFSRVVFEQSEMLSRSGSSTVILSNSLGSKLVWRRT